MALDFIVAGFFLFFASLPLRLTHVCVCAWSVAINSVWCSLGHHGDEIGKQASSFITAVVSKARAHTYSHALSLCCRRWCIRQKHRLPSQKQEKGQHCRSIRGVNAMPLPLLSQPRQSECHLQQSCRTLPLYYHYYCMYHCFCVHRAFHVGIPANLDEPSASCVVVTSTLWCKPLGSV